MKTTAALTIVLLLGCGGEEEVAPIPPGAPGAAAQAAAEVAPAPTAPPANAGAPVELTVDAATLAQSQAFAAAIAAAPRRRPEGINDVSAARATLHLAATSTDNAVLVRAFTELRGQYTRDARTAERGTRVMSDADVERVILARIDHPDAAVREKVILASGVLLGDPETSAPAAVTALVTIASNDPSPEVRMKALEALGSSRAVGDSAAHAAPFLAAFGAAQPHLVSSALFRFRGLARSYPDKAALHAAVRPLLQHADPGVRGRAIEVLASSTERGQEAATAALVLPLLEDPNPYTRSEAASALASLRHAPAIHALMTKLDDVERNTYDIRYTGMTGGNERVHHDGSAWSRVDDAILRALSTLARSVDRERPDYRVAGATKEADIAAAKVAYRAWYEAHRAEIPAQ